MNFNVFKYLDLSFEMPVMSNFQEITKHLNPKLIGWVGFKYDGGDVMLERLYDFDKMLSGLFFLHGG